MEELKLAVKAFVFASLIVMFSQMRVGGTTLERRGEVWLKSSATAVFLQGVAAGGIKALKKLTLSAQEMSQETMDGFSEGRAEQVESVETQKASKMKEPYY